MYTAAYNIYVYCQDYNEGVFYNQRLLYRPVLRYIVCLYDFTLCPPDFLTKDLDHILSENKLIPKFKLCHLSRQPPCPLTRFCAEGNKSELPRSNPVPRMDHWMARSTGVLLHLWNKCQIWCSALNGLRRVVFQVSRGFLQCALVEVRVESWGEKRGRGGTWRKKTLEEESWSVLRKGSPYINFI